MDVNPQKNIFKTKFILVFFCLVQFFSCKKQEAISDLNVLYENDNAVKVNFTSNLNIDSIKIYLKGITDTPVLGEIINKDGVTIFTPVVPFSKGKAYEIKYQNQLLKAFTIKQSVEHIKPELLAIYPTKDTVPENLLKMYFVFSKPMQEVKSALEYIKVTEHTKQEEVSVFLELQTELWNKDHTQLTLWLDPGRIKTDLIPNKKLGLPIVDGKSYTINVSKEFKDAYGNLLDKDYSKTIVVKERDSRIPDLNKWIVSSPQANTLNELTIDFGESLDFALALETVKILNPNRETVSGDFTLTNKESALKFRPNLNWESGNYIISVNTKLEDLAGNNLNHPFDKDLNVEVNNGEDSKIKSLQFSIE